jgi:hypothetical protein
MRILMAVPVVACAFLTACERTTVVPTELSALSVRASDALKPNFNLEVILRAREGAEGFGHVKFRQDNDQTTNRIDLGVWVRDLAPNKSYKLQRAADGVVDGECSGAFNVTLGKGAVPQDIVTDDRGTGREDLFRVLATTNRGTAFDIRFRVIDAAGNVVLTSDCYQFFVR